MKANKVIVALDTSNIKKVKEIVQKLKSEVYAFKIGYEFFLNHGIKGYNTVRKICPRIFLDLKYFSKFSCSVVLSEFLTKRFLPFFSNLLPLTKFISFINPSNIIHLY